MVEPKHSAFTGKLNTFVVRSPSAEIHSDFDNNGSLDYSVQERQVRYTRPGSIVLPNLNLSQGLASVPGYPPRPSVDLTDRRDADNEEIQGDEDLPDLTEFTVQTPSSQALLVDELILQVRAEDVNRFRVFLADGGSADSWPAVFGGSSGNDYSISFQPNTSWRRRFFIEALTLAGTPNLSGPTGATLNTPPPQPSGGTAPAGSGQPVYPQTGPGEIWVKLIHKRNGAELTNSYDVALFLIAPFLLQSNLEPCERIYVTYLKSGSNKPENHDFVYDLMEACWAAFGASGAFNRDAALEFTPGNPGGLTDPDDTTAGSCSLSPGKLYLIDGSEYGMDEWVQDEFEMGYCSAPGQRAFNVAMHCKRQRGLSNFVKRELANEDIGLFNELDGTRRDGTDFGGNIEVSPPVLSATGRINRGSDGPEVPSHPSAPFGKIILGDQRNTSRSGSGLVHDQTREFFKSQVVQPVIPINTSWLGVAHVDEFMSFVPSNTARGSCLLIASVYMMSRLLRKIIAVPFSDGRTHFHRGKFENHREMILFGASGNPITDPVTITDSVTTRSTAYETWRSYAEVSAEHLYTGDVGSYSRGIRTRFMIPIERRLMRCTAHGGEDVIKVPIYFKPGDTARPHGHPENLTVAETVGMVNMQVVNGHLMVPKPFGPRMPRDKAERIVEEVLGSDVTVRSLSDTSFPFWAWPGLSLDRVAQFFTHPSTAAQRNQIIRKIKDQSRSLSSALNTLIAAKKTQIETANPGMPLNAGGVFTQWKRLSIPENTVDVIETYMLTALTHIGRQVHFVDNWYYHVGWGEAHCATNAKRTPPQEATLAQKWWDVYDPSVDTSYDPTVT